MIEYPLYGESLIVSNHFTSSFERLRVVTKTEGRTLSLSKHPRMARVVFNNGGMDEQKAPTFFKIIKSSSNTDYLVISISTCFYKSMSLISCFCL